MSTWEWSYIVYGAWFLFWVVLEILGFLGVVPWTTLSATSWHIEEHWKLVKTVFLAGLTVLLVHIVFRWP